MKKTPSDEPLIELIAGNVRALMNFSGLKAHHLVPHCGGKSLSTVQRIMDGKTDLQLSTLEAIAKALNVEPWQLLVPDLNPDSLPSLLTPEVRETLDKLFRPSKFPVRAK